ncbi:MAG: VPS10 domain-containing protein [Gammaproteobacteria bacterium]
MRKIYPVLVLFTLIAAGAAQALPAPLFDGLSWRFVGPFRGGRVDAVAGVAGKPNLGYFGAVDGGVFKTTDAGVTWQSLFQHQAVASIGAIGIAASNPQIIYVGTGESTIRSDATYGNGIYRSDDGGTSWQHVGLDDSRHIGRLLVDPEDPDRVLVAALGHIWGPNKQRGVFLTTDGGKHWKNTLYVNEHTGAVDLARDPAHPASVYATTWNAERTPWFQYAPVNGPGSAIYHSSDGGESWRKLAMQGLPADMGRIGIAVADMSAGPRLYAMATGSKHGGVYRSDDGGAHWRLMNDEDRLWGRGWYFGRIEVDPANPDVVYVPNTSLYRSSDGGAHFTALKGSPNGDDFQRLWIDSKDPAHLITSADQGTSISLDNGAHWSSWFNQPTAQIYHISVDDQVPYWIYGTQQDSGALAIPSRSPDGIITNHDRLSVGGGGESGYIFPRQGDPSVIYGSGFGGAVASYNLRTQMSADISPSPFISFGAAPTATGYYFPWNTALALSPFAADTFYLGAQAVLASSDAGRHWKAISPTLTHKRKDTNCKGEPTRATAAACGYSVIYALAPSPVARDTLWAGTDDSRVWMTTDSGTHWKNVTPPHLGAWSRVDTIEADPQDAASAYVAVDRHQVDDFAPYIYITHDAGKHWRRANRGIPVGDYVRVVRADPERKGLLYAGTEQGIFVSFDDGHNWQSLQSNLPTASVRDIKVHADDLIVATHGRGIWILDDIEPLREASAKIAASEVHLYAPRPAVRFRLSLYHAEARPPEVPHAANPPTGAIIDYWLGKDAKAPVTLAVYDADSNLVRRYSSVDTPAKMPLANFPDYWKSPPNILPAKQGFNRFVWDLRYTPPTWPGARWAGSAVLERMPRGPLAPLALPGDYRVVLTVNGKDYDAALTLRADPNADTMPTALKANLSFGLALERRINRNAQLMRSAKAASAVAEKAGDKTRAKQIDDALNKLDLDHINGQLSGLLRSIAATDDAPAPTLLAAAAKLQTDSKRASDELAKLLIPGL